MAESKVGDLASRLGGLLSQDGSSQSNANASADTSKPATATAPTSAPAAPTSSESKGKGSAAVNGDAKAQANAGQIEEEGTSASASQLLQNFSNEVTVKLADQQADPNSPLYSVQSFEDLNLSPDLLKGVYKMGFQKPSKIQEKALPLLLQNPARNMIGQSQSGTGKTAAFVLTMLSRIDFSVNAPQAVCLAPSRELVRQIAEVIAQMGQYTPVQTFLATRGAVFKNTTINAHLIIGTPGTILDMAKSRGVVDLSKVKVLVLDEADNMLDEGSLGDQSINVKNLIMRANRDIQIVLFSATFSDAVSLYAQRFAPLANEIRLKKEELSLEAIKQFFMDCRDSNHRYEVLVELYSLLTIGQSIIFTRKRDEADEIARRMSAEGHKVTSLHGQLEPADRDRIMDDFKNGRSKVLITTNVIARGIDILQVNVVVNYDLPVDQHGRPDVETYIHRIGRTGRFGRKGMSINFVYDHRSHDTLAAIEKAQGRPITRVETSDFDDMEETLNKILKS